eukprot:TRINITY_DN1342_c0_g1_i1.p1 TRINITY_DN1342_c0_g1~~TRINITY_DN1342_c0_g1_i1.p1  ORF type:complete len:623 (+),score=235.33 TRINITY_DN1342_c0_g1_i1:48-1871(+)
MRHTHAFAGGATAVAVCLLLRRLHRRRRAAEMMEVALSKRAERDAALEEAVLQIPRFEDIEDGARIVQMTALELRDAIARQELSSEQVVTAFCARAIQAGAELNCNAEVRYLEAIADAKLCDAEQRAGKLRGVLHGVPFSVKEQIDQKGFDSTCGMAAKCFQKRTHDSLLVTCLTAEGGIPFVRTTLPQGMMLVETNSHVWGHALNPFDTTRTPGGSSGGEGALIGCFGSPWGIGTDIGGSIRIPAAFCGITGFKPTPMRMSTRGNTVSRRGAEGEAEGPGGQLAVLPTGGPMGRTVGDCELLMKIWCDSMYLSDPLIPRTPWDSPTAKGEKKFTFGVLRWAGFFPTCGAVDRALDLAIKAVRAEGHTVVEFPYDMEWAYPTYVQILCCAGALRGFFEALEGEDPVPEFEVQHEAYVMPFWISDLLIVPALRLLGYTRLADCVESSGAIDANDFLNTVAQKEAHKKKMSDKMLEMGVDALLCPQTALPPVRIGSTKTVSAIASSTTLFNLLAWPAGVVPVTYVKEEEQVYDPALRGGCYGAGDSIEKGAVAQMVGSAGLPLAVQVATPSYQDELCMGAMRVVEKAVSGIWKRPSITSASTATISKGE